MGRLRRGPGAAVAMAVAITLGVGGATSLLAGPAEAGGGSVLQPDREAYQPGDPVHLVADVSKTDRDWFGPYTVFLHRYDPAETPIWYEAGHQDAADLVVGRLVVSRIDERRVRAEVTFVLPKLTDGWWTVGYCNPGCTRTLGDLYAGALYVGTLPAAPWPTVAPTTVAPVTVPPLSSVPTTRARASDPRATGADAEPVALAAAAPAAPESPPDARSVGWSLAGLGGLVVLASALVVALRRGGPRRTVTTSGRPLGDPPPDGVVTVAIDPRRPEDEPIGAGR